jgi:dTDP-4-dehydrorhamnose 3,5-epimerase
LETALPDVFLIQPDVHSDARGFFLESYHQQKFEQLGIRERFVQDNHSLSVRATLRGFHYQLQHPQSKLCRVVHGEVLDVAVDIRRGSPNFGKWASAKLSAENKIQIYVPKGFAHGFMVLSETAEFLYKCSDFYHPEDEYGVLWNDAGLSVNWGIDQPILSAKDQKYSPLNLIPPHLLPIFEGQGVRAFKRRLLSLGKHPPVLRARNAALESAGYEVVAATTVEQATRALKAQQFELVIVGYTFSKSEKRKISDLVENEHGVPMLLLYIKPGDKAIPAAAHISAVHGEGALLSAVAAILSDEKHSSKSMNAGPPRRQ